MSTGVAGAARVGPGRVLTVLLAVVGALGAGPSGAAGQSLLGTGGLGVPVSPVDARGVGMGNLGIGLSGASILPTDPAAAADLVLPAVTFTMQHSWVDLEGEGAEPTASGTRFPIVGVAYPVSDHGMATLTFGSVLDQRWDSEVERLVDLGSGETARVTDRFSSDGGLSAIRLGFARRIAPSLAVGVSAGAHTGDISRVFTRRFDSLGLETGVPAFSTGGRWTYSAPTVTGGAQVDVGNFLRVSGSLTWSGSLEADPDDDTAGGPRSFDLPLQYRVGAMGVLAPGLQVSASAHYADWSETGDGGFEGGGGTEVLDLGGGLEWREPSIFGRTTPIRLGYRRTELPFLFRDEEASESTWTGGLGMNLVESGPVSIAQVDLGVERGNRSAGDLTERFWRATVTLRVAGL